MHVPMYKLYPDIHELQYVEFMQFPQGWLQRLHVWFIVEG